jgi:two-component system OmpR family sensor kinase
VTEAVAAPSRRRTTTLRTRLALTVAFVAIAAIVVVDLTTYRVLSTSLYERLDRQLERAVQEPPPGEQDGQPSREPPPPADGSRPLPGRAPARDRAMAAGTWTAAWRDVGASGTTEDPVQENVAGVRAETIDDRDRPKLTLDAEQLQTLLDGPTTLPAKLGDGRFRVTARRLRGTDVLVAAMPLDDIDTTRQGLMRIEFIVGLVAALGVAVLASVTVRAGLRPLEAIADAAGDIADDGAEDGIGRRVPAPADQPAEVARVAAALNAMLDRIDGSIVAQQRAQARLRQFVADASHELRTPLTSIQGYAELARTRGSEMGDDDRDAALARVESEAEHLGRLVEDMLLLSRLDEGLPMHPVDTDVAAIAATAVDAARVIEPARDISFDSGGPVRLVADPVRVRQLVDNLLANARTHAGPDADVSVSVRSSADGRGAELVVSDTGVGLSADQRAAATDRFWRSDDARTRATGGSGLGLSIVRSIAEAHGGSVRIGAGEDGRGLEVRVQLTGA